jgi:hypothetical protein
MKRTLWHLSITPLTVWLILLGTGCAGVRPARLPAELLAQRQAPDAQQAEKGRAFGQRMLERLKARYDAHPGAPLMYDILVLSGGGAREERTLPAVWAALYLQLPVPTVRFWVIFNNQLRPLPQVTSPTWPAIVACSLEMGTRAATVTAIRHLFTQAEISHLKRGGDVEVRVVAVPNDFVPPKEGVFIKETMNALADLGERLGTDPASWRTEAP